MARIKVEFAPRPGLLSTTPGDVVGGLPIHYTAPDDPQAGEGKS